jgi:hypothetical protein
MSAENNKGIVRRFFEGALGKGNERDTEVLDPHCTLNAPVFLLERLATEMGSETSSSRFAPLSPTLISPSRSQRPPRVATW